MIKSIFLVLLLFIIGCSSENCHELSFKSIYYELYGSDYTSASHYLYSEKYNNRCRDSIDFYGIAKVYSDTVKNYLPIGSIVFVSSTEGFDSANKEIDGNIVKKNIIYTVFFHYSKLDKKSYIDKKASF
jgi:hypothetical protein